MSELFYYDNALADARDLGPFSDLFRFKLLLEQGGWYCDVDTVCLAEEIPACPRAWAREMVELDRLCVGAGQIALAAGDPLARTLYERCLARSKTTGYAREDLGPRLISSVVGESGLPVDMVGRPETFYPIRWIEIFKLWLPDFTAEVRERLDGAWFLPIYQSFPRYCGLDDPDRLPPVGSFLHQFSLECDPRLEHAECYPAADVRAATWSFFEREGDWAIAELVTVSGPETVDRLRP